LSLGLTDIKADTSAAQPTSLAMSTARPAALPAIILPESMEAVVR